MRTTTNAAEVAIIGGGASGAVLALHLARLRPDWPVVLIDDGAVCGQGLAYGRCTDEHLLNVPVARMDVGVAPTFKTWIGADGAGDAFVARASFGAYLTAQLTAACTRSALRLVHGRAAQVQEGPTRSVQLEDGAIIRAERVVLAIGNLPPGSPLPPASRIGAPVYVADPWRADAFDGLQDHDAVLFIGSGLTMVDQATTLLARGHRGALHAVSRRGLVPMPHLAGGDWRPFLGETPQSPRLAIALLRAEARKAAALGIPWQRVVDAVRPDAGRLWNAWSTAQKAQFLRHARAFWDVHRHRMAPELAARVDEAVGSGALTISAGRIASAHASAEGAQIIIHGAAGARKTLSVSRVINCTGPNTKLMHAGEPLVEDLWRRGLVRADALRLGLETEACAVVNADGAVSSWLYAIGPLTRPAWWEITAMPEIGVQTRRLAEALVEADIASAPASIQDEFFELGAGI